MVYRICPVCEKPVDQDSEIILNKKLSKPNADKVRELHGKIMGYAKRICNECHEKIGTGIYLVGILEAKTEDKRNPYRSGNIIGIKREAFERIFNKTPPEGQVCWTEDEIILWIREQEAKS